MQLAELLTRACESGASDLHLSAAEPPRVRVDGDMKLFGEVALTADELRDMIFGITADAQQRKYDGGDDLDFSHEIETVARFRVNAFHTRRGPGAVFRAIPNQILGLEDLGMPAVLKELCAKEKGLVLVTGPTGSGKTTTLAAMIDYINANSRRHVLTIEDPIEFVHQSKSCLINQREIGTHANCFTSALRAALREDPDVILVGEMRDLETVSLAITAAETGHLVFATLHTSSAAKTINRIIDVFPPAQQEQIRVMFSDSMQAVLCQTLLRKKTGGRVAAMEILLGTPAIRNLIREGKGHQIPSAIQMGQKIGMQPMDVALADLVRRDIVSKEEAEPHGSGASALAQSGSGGALGQPAVPSAAPGNRLAAMRA